MLSRVSTTIVRRSMATNAVRSFATVKDAATANDALKFSGYSEIDFKISEDAPTYDAVQKFAAFNIGCLVTTDAAGKQLSP
jgi:predicted transcriptional regulator